MSAELRRNISSGVDSIRQRKVRGRGRFRLRVEVVGHEKSWPSFGEEVWTTIPADKRGVRLTKRLSRRNHRRGSMAGWSRAFAKGVVGITSSCTSIVSAHLPSDNRSGVRRLDLAVLGRCCSPGSQVGGASGGPSLIRRASINVFGAIVYRDHHHRDLAVVWERTEILHGDDNVFVGRAMVTKPA